MLWFKSRGSAKCPMRRPTSRLLPRGRGQATSRLMAGARLGKEGAPHQAGHPAAPEPGIGPNQAPKTKVTSLMSRWRPADLFGRWESTSGQEVTRGAGGGGVQSHRVLTSLLTSVLPPHPRDAPELPGQQQGQKNGRFYKKTSMRDREQGAARSPSAVGQGEEEEEEGGPRATAMAVCRSSGGFPWQPQAQGAHHT